jgi:hypothetical protein
MKATDLRIGNRVMDSDGVYLTVNQDNFKWYDSMYPIPLTAEILGKAGWKKD